MDVVRRLDVIKSLTEHAAYWLVTSVLLWHAIILTAFNPELVVVANYYMHCEWIIVKHAFVYFPNETAGLYLMNLRL